jgi:hypothetical protein
LGALIAFCLAANREKGGVCGGLIASRLLALHGVEPHILDLQFPLERLDYNSMLQHKFVSPHACLDNLSFEITFFKKSSWRMVKTNRSVHLPAPLFFNLDRRNGWSVTEEELDTYLEEHPYCTHDDGEGTDWAQAPSPPAPGKARISSPMLTMGHLLHLHESLIMAIPLMTHQSGVTARAGIDLHLGQKG